VNNQLSDFAQHVRSSADINIGKIKTHHEMRIPESDVTYIVLSDYLLTLFIDSHRTGTSTQCTDAKGLGMGGAVAAGAPVGSGSCTPRKCFKIYCS